MEQNSRSIPYYRSLDWITRASLRLVRANAKRILWAAVGSPLLDLELIYMSARPARVEVAVRADRLMLERL